MIRYGRHYLPDKFLLANVPLDHMRKLLALPEQRTLSLDRA